MAGTRDSGLARSAVSGAEESQAPLVSASYCTAIVVLGYLALIGCAALFLHLCDALQGYDDFRDTQATLIFAVVMAIPLLQTVIRIYNPPEAWRADLARVFSFLVGAWIGLIVGVCAAWLVIMLQSFNPVRVLWMLLGFCVLGGIYVNRHFRESRSVAPPRLVLPEQRSDYLDSGASVQLYQFLVRAFTTREIIHALQLDQITAGLAHMLPSYEVPVDSFMGALVSRLDVDPAVRAAFFKVLINVRPVYNGEILRISDLYGVVSHGGVVGALIGMCHSGVDGERFVEELRRLVSGSLMRIDVVPDLAFKDLVEHALRDRWEFMLLYSATDKVRAESDSLREFSLGLAEQLNAVVFCVPESVMIAEAIVAHIPWAIGIRGRVSPYSARRFAEVLFLSLSQGLNVSSAHVLARAGVAQLPVCDDDDADASQAARAGDAERFILCHRPGSEPATMYLVPRRKTSAGCSVSAASGLT